MHPQRECQPESSEYESEEAEVGRQCDAAVLGEQCFKPFHDIQVA
jgi:hypothetical protein